ncbi:fluoride efflux transporter CrcB [Herbiconiux sp. CPCC 205763]|uniref:Fluoride-specific ion channel FluC n=1 Tax=Herbiconiux aconitum TaxID=2970913 RepID=A0ABT2GM85_9MICO|nr:fluoride efflux transporter CrcB [Herbiconiux aconitum]MCS5717335.1 fluoride efflux transporter CrcB [Herbiconiux aconitum]
MTPLVFLALSAAGGVGAAARFFIDGAVKARIRGSYPVGTTIINVTGSLLLGLVTGLALSHLVTDDWRLVLGGGFLGGYTTFSTASFETVRLAQNRRWGAALANGLGMMVASVAAAGLGLWLGSLA